MERAVDLHLSGKTAVVTGASRGMGLAITRSLAAEGARVAAGALKGSEELEKVISDYPDVRLVEGDLSAADGPARLVDEAVAAFGGVDILVNNLGGSRRRQDGFLGVTEEDWDWGLLMNLRIPVRACRAALPHMLSAGKGAIVNVSSVMADVADPDVYDYTAAKAALTNFTQALAREFGSKGIKINTVSPGPTESDMWTGKNGVAIAGSQATGLNPREFMDRVASHLVTGRFNKPQEVADVVLLLASDRAGNMMGADVRVDGGYFLNH